MKRCSSCGSLNHHKQSFCGSCGASLQGAELISGDPYIDYVVEGKYRIERDVGSGGMAKVYQARAVEDDTVVAVKLMHAHFVGDPVAVQRFEREVKLASALDHPNVVSLLDFGTLPTGLAYLVMEFLQGPTLADVVERGALEPLRAIRIIRQILQALEPAHGQGIVHRDLKPENVILCVDRPEPDFVKVLDFGIARLRHGSSKNRITETGVICGTPEYMSPEQCLGSTVDARSDVYSAGIVFYEMLTGTLPFYANSVAEIMDAQIFRTPQPPSQRQQKHPIPQSLDAIIMWALAKNPMERFSSAREFLEVLDQWELVYGRDQEAPRESRECPQCRRPMPAGVEAVICPWCGWRPQEAHTPQASAPPRAARRGKEPTRLKLPGKAARVADTVLADHERDSALRRRTTLDVALPFFGRERQLATLDRSVTRPGFQRYRLTGDHGSGKSLASSNLLALAASEGRRPIQAPLREWAIPEPLKAIRGMATSLLDLPCEPLTNRDLDAAALRIGYPPGHLTALRELFGVPGTFSPMIPVDYRRRSRAEAWRVLVELAARRQPLVLLFDGLEDLDGASRDLVLNLAASPVNAPAILLVTHGPEMLTLWPSQFPTLTLTPLLQEEALELVARLGGELLSTARIDEIVLRGRGNPLLLRELVALASTDKEGVLTDSLPAVLSARIHRLPPQARQIAGPSAIIGDEVSADLLVELAAVSEGALSWSKADVRRGLDQLVDAAFMTPIGTKHRFHHHQQREALQVSLIPDQRRLLHGLVGTLLSDVGAPARVLAHHFLRSGQLTLALPTLLASAYQFLESLDEESAEELFRQAIDVASNWQQQDSETLHRSWARAVRGLADTLRQVGRKDEAESILETARAQVKEAQSDCANDQLEILG